MENFSQDALPVLTEACNLRDEIIWIHDLSKGNRVFVNEYGRIHYGFSSNWLNEDDLRRFESLCEEYGRIEFERMAGFFRQNPASAHRVSVRSNGADGKEAWRYIVGQALPYNKADELRYAICIEYEIEELLHKGQNSRIESFVAENQKRYDALTSREKQVLSLIALEMTSQEIAKKLFIQHSTVNTHRKNLIRKLGVKSSIGLVKFALVFSDKY